MSSPEKPPPAKPANLLTKQVPWGAPKAAAKTATAKPATAALSAKQVPWGAAKPPAKAEPTVTVTPAPMPSVAATAAPATLLPPTPPARSLIAKLVPWGAPKAAVKQVPLETAAPEPPLAEPATQPVTWALPKTAELSPGQTSPELMPEPLGSEARSAGEPTAAELVSILSRRLTRKREKSDGPEIVPQPAIYKAKPISFAATRWDVVRMWADTHRLRLSLIGVALVLLLGTVQFVRLASLNQKVDREWHDLETVLRQRYDLIPAYVECIMSFSTEERYTMAVTQKGLAAWRTARTDRDIVAAAQQLERVLILLSKVMNRYDQNTVAKEEAQIDSSLQFARLEAQRKLSLARMRETSQSYNETVEKFNGQVQSPPGTWVASLGHLHARSGFYPLGQK
jgi:hypothetical protein